MFPGAEIVERASLEIRPVHRLPDDVFIELRSLFIAGELFFACDIIELIRGVRQFRFHLDGALGPCFRFGRNCRNGRFRRRCRRRCRGQFRSEENAEEEKQRFGGAGFPVISRALRDQKIDQQKNSCRYQRQRELLNRNRAFSPLMFRLIEPFDPVLDRGQAGVGDGAPDINSAGFRGQPPQIDFVEPGGHQFSVAVPLERAVLLRHRRPDFRIPEADDEDGNLLFLQFIDNAAAVAGEFVAVGHQHDRPVSRRRRLECGHRGVERQLQIGSPERHCVGGKFIDVLVERQLVRGERAGQVGVSGKCDQTEPVPGIGLHQLPEQKFCMVQPRRSDVGRPHALGDVEQHHEIPAVRFVGHQLGVPEGTGRRRDEKEHRQKQTAVSQAPPGG